MTWALATLRALGQALRTLGRALRTRLMFAAAAFVGAMIPLAAATQWPSEIILFLLLAVGIGVPLALFVLLVRTQIMSTVTGVALAFAGIGLPLPGYPQFLSGVAGRWGFVLLLLPVVMAALWLIGWLVDLVVRTDRRLGDKGRPVPPPVPGSGLVLRPPSLPVRPGVVRGVASVSTAIAMRGNPALPEVASASAGGSGPGGASGSGVRPRGITVEYRTAGQPPVGERPPVGDEPYVREQPQAGGPPRVGEQRRGPEQPAPGPDRAVIEGDVITRADHPLD